MADALRRKRALVIGGSISGLFVARLLARQGWEVRVFERVAEDLRSRGAGIATHPQLFQALNEATIKTATDFGVRVDRRRVLDMAGLITHDVSWPQIMASWASIYALLRDGLGRISHETGKALTRFESMPSGIGASFTDGSSAEADVLIGADGFRSTTRRQLLPHVLPSYVGYIAWRGKVPEERLSRRTRENVFRHFCFCLPRGEQMAGYPVNEVVEGSATPKRAYNFIWYRPLEAARLSYCLTDAKGTLHELNVPPPLVRPDIIAEMRRAAEELLSPEFVDIVEQTGEPFFQPIYDLEVPAMRQGRVALIGDAAFVARPHVGAGVTKAFQDGVALARSLKEDDIDEGLAAFSAQRTPVGQRVVERGRQLGAIMREDGASEAKRAHEMMMGSATLDFLP